MRNVILDKCRKSIHINSLTVAVTKSENRIIKKIGYMWPMLVLGLVTMVDNADQSIVRGVALQIERTFHVGDFQISLLGAAATVVNALVTMPAGYLADRWHRVRSIMITVLLWSLLSTFGAFSPTFFTLFMVRSLLGFGQGITEPSGNSLLADYYERNGRARAFSMQQALLYVGVALGTTGSSIIGQHLGWRAAYLMVSIPGLGIALLVLLLHEPFRGSSDYSALKLRKEDEPKKIKLFDKGFGNFAKNMFSGLYEDVKTILKIPTLRLTLVGVASILFTVSAIGFWLPVFYLRSFHLTQSKAGIYFGIMVILGGLPGLYVGGKLSDRLVPIKSETRVVIPGVCAIVSVSFFLLSFANLTLLPTVILQTVGFFAGTMAVPALRAGLSDVTPGTLRGTGFGAFNLTSVIFGSAIAPTVVGFFSQLFGNNLRVAFIIVLPPVYIGSYLLIRARKHIDKDSQAIFQRILEANKSDD